MHQLTVFGEAVTETSSVTTSHVVTEVLKKLQTLTEKFTTAEAFYNAFFFLHGFLPVGRELTLRHLLREEIQLSLAVGKAEVQ